MDVDYAFYFLCKKWIKFLMADSPWSIFFVLFCFCFSRQGFSVALVNVLELALVEQASLEVTEIHLLLHPESWDQRRVPLPPSKGSDFKEIKAGTGKVA